MAESSITFFVKKLGDLAVQEASLFGEVEGQISLLRNELEWTSLFLEEASATHTDDRRLKLWMNQIRDAAYDAEDVIDEFVFRLEHQRQRRLHNLEFLRFLPTCVTFADKLPFVHELDARIRETNAKIEKILANKSRYCVENPMASGVWSSSNEVVPWGEKRVPIVEEADVVGMTNDVEAIKRDLLEGEMERGVVAIVGMGGLGKTTLAKKVYNDSGVNRHFNCRALVYVSQEYTIRELLMGIANCLLSQEDKTQISNMVENKLGEKVCDYLKEKRYLIVLDDVWSIQVWDRLSSYLPESNHSRVLITTRNQQIASHAYSKLYELHPLGEAESWELFLKKTFRVGSTSPVECPPNLEDLGKKITEKCKGLPLAIVVLGGLLSRKDKTESLWEKMLKSMEWHLSQGPESCLGILGLSYSSLPYFLKSCFLYCGVFQEDREIKASKLIQMWIVEGFVQGRGEEIVEDIAEEYLEELIHRSMIQVAKRKRDGRVKSCRIHDLLRDLAVSKAKESNFFEVCSKINFAHPFNPRRLIAYDSQSISQHLHSCQRLRSLICSIDYPQVSLMCCLGTKLLTVLDLTLSPNCYYVQERELPKELGEFIHLKYFSLKNVDPISFPWSIGKLINLQILDLRNSSSTIPFSIWKLHQLRHLYIGRSEILSQSMMERCFSGHLGLDKMTNLQTLFLRPCNWLESCGLEKLTQLRKLHLYGRSFKNSYELYPSNLVELKLEDCYLQQDPMLVLDKFPNLKVLKLMLYSYLGRKITCSSGGFPQLEFLRLDCLYSLKELQVEEGAMPNLKTLQIAHCSGMEKLLHELLKLKNLQQVNLESMNDQLIEEVENTEGEEFDKIRLITSIIKHSNVGL